MPRTLVVGFDGATLELAERWIADGRMPNLEAVLRDGSYGAMASAFPYNSAVAWTSLSTGVRPTRHGVFDFVLPSPGEYALRVATRQDRRVPALWNHASNAGARVAVFNIPMTFPAETVNGVMVSGMDAPRLEERATHPADLLPSARSVGYRIMSKAPLEASRGDFEAAERELLDAMTVRSRFVADLIGTRDFDLAMVNLEATDGAHHFFWQHHDPTHPRHDPRLAARWGDAIGRVYEATDRELGRLVDAFAPDTVFVVSDHGGGASSDWLLFINDWLIAEGFLAVDPGRSSTLGRRLYELAKRRLSAPARNALRPLFGRALDRARETALYGDVDWSRSVAYAQMQPSVRLNRAGREAHGIVGDAEAPDVVEQIALRALEMTLPTGEPLVVSAQRVEDVYGGADERGPDVILHLAAGTHIRSRNGTGRPGFVHRLSDIGMYLPSGTHTPVGLVAAAGSGIERRGRAAEPFDIHQVAASVLAVMGVPAPELDGDPFDFIAATRVEARGRLESEAAEATGFSAEEEALVLERLRGLGYVD